MTGTSRGTPRSKMGSNQNRMKDDKENNLPISRTSSTRSMKSSAQPRNRSRKRKSTLPTNKPRQYSLDNQNESSRTKTTNKSAHVKRILSSDNRRQVSAKKSNEYLKYLPPSSANHVTVTAKKRERTDHANNGKENKHSATSTSSSSSMIPPRQMSIMSEDIGHASSIHSSTQYIPAIDDSTDNVRVVVRVRPLSDREVALNHRDVVIAREQNGEETSIYINDDKKNVSFCFNAVLDNNSNQEEVFHVSGIKRLIDMSINGYTCTCFAYGQTGSGKTYTITGPENVFVLSQELKQKTFGLIPRSFVYLFSRLREYPESTFYIRVSYCEIYNEQIRDLISPNKSHPLAIRWSRKEGFYVDNLFHTYIESLDDLLAILEEGASNRVTAGHELNQHSSRSHAILSLSIENETPHPEDRSKYYMKKGKLVFVDLAGSEKVKISGSSGIHLTETNNINKSLLTLGNCISALSDPKQKDKHIPYRDSKLTKLLSQSLGGNGVALMIACISPANSCSSESISTLRYALRARCIKNNPIVRMDTKETVILSLKMEIKQLKRENDFLRKELGIPGDNATYASSVSTLPKPKKGQTSEELYDMLQKYIKENNDLRNERETIIQDSEKTRKEYDRISRENQMLINRLEKLVQTAEQSQYSTSNDDLRSYEDEPVENRRKPLGSRTPKKKSATKTTMRRTTIKNTQSSNSTASSSFTRNGNYTRRANVQRHQLENDLSSLDNQIKQMSRLNNSSRY
ncbi:hypothetical protein SNEBB_006742 [Seison nebaliae]|nr:hypothetical protein SNEBB_006742 [Seison nebaliae]